MGWTPFIVFYLIFISGYSKKSDAQFHNNPGNVKIHENEDDRYTVWQDVNATCTVTTECTTTTLTPPPGPGIAKEPGLFGCEMAVPCDYCWVTSDDLFEADGLAIVKKACDNPGCGPECTDNYCLNGPDVLTVDVACNATGYLSSETVVDTLTVTVLANMPPTIGLKNGSSVTITKDYKQGDVINEITYVDPNGDDISYSVVYSSISVAYDPYTTRSDKLFVLKGNEIKVVKDLAYEFSNTYKDIEVCVADRRDQDCTTFSIRLEGCFEKPTCTGKNGSVFTDQHAIGDSLVDMTVPDPSTHFADFNAGWAQLTWKLTYSDLDVADVDESTGVLRTTNNITVWPSYPSRNYYATVEVENSESCGRTSSCTVTFTVEFTNFDIRFANEGYESSKHENYDEGFEVFRIVTYDYNAPDQDNVTCSMSFTPYEENMFELKNDNDRYSYDSWYIWRKPCQAQKCEHTCPQEKGCFNHDITPSYTFTVTCEDAYGSSDTADFKLNILDNNPPVFTDPNDVTVSISKETHHQDSPVITLSAENSDFDIDDDYIRWNVTDESKFFAWDYVARTDKLFYLEGSTGELFVAKDLSMEYSFIFRDIEICIADRRDAWICKTVTINMTACYEIPTCENQEYFDFWDTHTVEGTMFDMKYPSPTMHFVEDFRKDWLDLTWTLIWSDLDVAEVVQNQEAGVNEGVMHPSANITVWPSWRYRNYSAVIDVSNSESCERTTQCVMNFSIWFTNWNIRFENLPEEIHVHENNDTEFEVHHIITYDYNDPSQDNVTCNMSFTPHEDNIFELRDDSGFRYNSWSIWRLPCQQPKCEYDCPLKIGCFTHRTTADHKFVFTVTCRDAYDSYVTDYFTLHLIDNSPPYFTYEDDEIVYISKETHTEDDVVTQIFAEDTDQAIDDDYIRWNVTDDTKLIAWDYPNITRADRLFYLDGLTGFIYVAKDLSIEYSFVFRNIEICIADRRDAWICKTITINMTACYEIPTCYDQEYLDFWDTHAVGDTLFNMAYPDPTYHFPDDFDPFWQDLGWTLEESDLDVAEVVQSGLNDGIMRTNANITVWPYWRYRDYNATIRVNNSKSCGRTTTCLMTFRIWFKNWPIEFISLPAENVTNEDYNDEFLVHQIITYDYNFHEHDNVTCNMTFEPYEENLFELRHDGSYDYNSWSIWRFPCQEPTCGFHCDKGIGCFTYNTTLNQQFVFTVQCWDAYDSNVTDTYTLHLDFNRAPRFLNLPRTINLDSDKVSDGDILYSIQYEDNENENMHYNYSFSDGSIWNGRLIFKCDEFGNYFDNRANISSTVYFHEMPTTNYGIYICGTERRNMICEWLTIKVLDNCPGNPTCAGGSTTEPDSIDIGTKLFEIKGTNDENSTGSLSYSFVSQTPSFFDVDESTGVIRVAKKLIATFPSKTYQLTAFVYDSQACNYGSCQFTVTSLFTNYNISIVNENYAYSNLHEDTEINMPLFTIYTEDDNTDDTVTCSMKNITSPYATEPIPQNLFRVTQTYRGSNVWIIENRELPDFTAAVTEYRIHVECRDKYGSSDEAIFEVTIQANEAPTFKNLNDSTAVLVDHSVDGKGSIIYVVSTADEENDVLLFTSEVDNSFVPLALTEDGKVYLRRDVSIEKEDGTSYFIKICINDTRHNLQPEVCERLNVTFISSQKYPSISNLPNTTSFPEDTVGGTELFRLEVSDENEDSFHTFTMRVYPSVAEYMFSLHTTTGVLSLQPGASFNYEDCQTYTFTFGVRDQYLVGLQRRDLILNITNVNEQPTLAILTKTVTFKENTNPGQVLANSVASCRDVDKDDTLTFGIENTLYSDYLDIDNFTSTLSLVKEWDLESTLLSSTSLNIICTDAGGLSDKKSISINVSPVNEFAPVISPTNITAHITSETTVLESLGRIESANDIDYGDDGNFIYLIPGLGYGAMYFTITNYGELRIKSKITLDYDNVFRFTIAVSDNDNTPRPRSAFCIVTVNYTAPNTVVIPERPTYCTTCTTEGKLVVATCAFMCLLLCAFIAHCVRHCMQVKKMPAMENVNTGVLGNNGSTANAWTDPIAGVSSEPKQQLNDTLGNQQTRNEQSTSENDTKKDSRNDDDDDDSISDDTDIDERLLKNQLTPMRNQPLPGALYSSSVSGFPHFGTGNYV